MTGAPRTPPRVLLVHYTYTQQALTLSDAMAGELREHGCDVTRSGDRVHRLTVCRPGGQIRSLLALISSLGSGDRVFARGLAELSFQHA